MTTPSKPSFWQREPALLVGQVHAALALAATLGFAFSSNTTASIVSAATLVGALLGAVLVRSKVSSPATVAKLVAVAAANGAVAAVVPPPVVPKPTLGGP